MSLLFFISLLSSGNRLAFSDKQKASVQALSYIHHQAQQSSIQSCRACNQPSALPAHSGSIAERGDLSFARDALSPKGRWAAAPNNRFPALLYIYTSSPEKGGKTFNGTINYSRSGGRFFVVVVGPFLPPSWYASALRYNYKWNWLSFGLNCSEKGRSGRRAASRESVISPAAVLKGTRMQV